jgi:long-chain acyl-CoA synthetase
MSPPGNLAADLRASARTSPEKPALIFKGSRISYADADSQADRVAAGLFKLGIRKGDRVAFVVGNRPTFVALYYGILRAGAIAVPINTSLRAAELRPYLNQVAPRAIVADEAVASEVMTAGPHACPVFVVGKHPTARPFEEILTDAAPHEAETGPDDVAVLAYTSGTSGAPKGAALTHGNLSANVDQLLQVRQTRVEPGDVVLGVLPMFHIYSLNVVLGMSVRQGATVALEERFDPAATLASVAGNGVTVIVGAPPMYLAWLALPDPARYDLSKVRFAVSGASALPAHVIEDFRKAFGVEIWEGYGLTETSPAVATTGLGEQRAGSIGKVLPGQEVRIVDASGQDVAPGDPGEIWVRGPNVFKGYWGEDAATEAAFSGEWFRTGDVAYRDEDGYLWLVDRQKELIIVSGFNVYPKEVEEALETHPAVADVAVVGEPDPRQGERVKAYVVLKPATSASEEELIVHCTRLLARFKVPTEIAFAKQLPHLATGKVLKRMLRPGGFGGM